MSLAGKVSFPALTLEKTVVSEEAISVNHILPGSVLGIACVMIAMIHTIPLHLKTDLFNKNLVQQPLAN